MLLPHSSSVCSWRLFMVFLSWIWLCSLDSLQEAANPWCPQHPTLLTLPLPEGLSALSWFSSYISDPLSLSSFDSTSCFFFSFFFLITYCKYSPRFYFPFFSQQSCLWIYSDIHSLKYGLMTKVFVALFPISCCAPAPYLWLRVSCLHWVYPWDLTLSTV